MDASTDDVFAYLAIFTQRLGQEDERELFAWNPGESGSVFRVSVVSHDGVQQLRLSAMGSEGDTSHG